MARFRMMTLMLLALAGPAMGQRDYGGGRSAARFYMKDGFEGRSVLLDRPTPDFRAIDLDDKTSSIEIVSGRWLVCADPGFRGRCEVIDHSIKHLSGRGFDDQISSARPLDDNRGPPPSWGDRDRGRDRYGDRGPLPGGSWARSCRGGRSDGPMLSAQCDDGRGNWRDTAIDLRQCRGGRAGNQDGRLTCE